MAVAELERPESRSESVHAESRYARIQLAEELLKRSETRSGSWRYRFHYLRKQWLWHVCIAGSKLLKRAMDAAVALLRFLFCRLF